MIDKSPNLTDAQNDLCFEIKLSIVGAIINMNNDTMWKLIQKSIDESEEKDNENE